MKRGCYSKLKKGANIFFVIVLVSIVLKVDFFLGRASIHGMIRREVTFAKDMSRD